MTKYRKNYRFHPIYTEKVGIKPEKKFIFQSMESGVFKKNSDFLSADFRRINSPFCSNFISQLSNVPFTAALYVSLKYFSIFHEILKSMTVKEHLIFYAKLKANMKSKELKKDINE
jgi:hypothetical protein